MAKTFTQNNLVSVSFGDSEDDSSLFGSYLDDQLLNMVDQIKNLRVRPSFGSIERIMDYASTVKAELN